MIGLVGIFANEKHMHSRERESVIKRTLLDTADFTLTTVSMKNVTMGLIQRSWRKNKDLSLKQMGDVMIGFSGYGKFSGEKKLYWAEEMIERIFPVVLQKSLNVLTSIEGSFQCIIITNDEYIIISDRFGSKSFYISINDKNVLFAPNVTSIMNTGLIKKEKNIKAAKQVLISGFFLDDSTLVKGVIRFPPATIFKGRIEELNTVNRIKYWEMPKKEGQIDTLDEDVISAFKEKIQNSIYECHELEPNSAVPLSGGLDSRAIACFLARKQKINTITYDFGDESTIADKVSKALGGDATFFKKKMIQSEKFRKEFTFIVQNQYYHCVPNQYFYVTLFRKYFIENPSIMAIYDGIYLDSLFNPAYVMSSFDINRFISIYGSSIKGLLLSYPDTLLENDVNDEMLQIYYSNLKGFENSDGVAKSQLLYMAGRLRRYVSESFVSRENYCYVFKPGFNYELMDFGFNLSLRLRKGLLYTTLLSKEFPDIMKIIFKDSRGNRKKTIIDKIEQFYSEYRLKISYASQGLFKYYPYQADYYFLREKGIEEFEDIFKKHNYIKEIVNNNQLAEIYEKTKRKQYLLNRLCRILFIQHFYHKNLFSE